jgi:CBS domain-containing protein
MTSVTGKNGVMPRPAAWEPAFDRSKVSDAMNPEVLTCPRAAPLALVARMMATENVHCIVVEGSTEDGRGWAIVSDLDLVAASTGALEEGVAGSVAASEFLTVAPDEDLARAAQMMVEHETSHLIVVDPLSDRALGVLSTLDVARAMAAGR